MMPINSYFLMQYWGYQKEFIYRSMHNRSELYFKFYNSIIPMHIKYIHLVYKLPVV